MREAVQRATLLVDREAHQLDVRERDLVEDRPARRSPHGARTARAHQDELKLRPALARARRLDLAVHHGARRSHVAPLEGSPVGGYGLQRTAVDTSRTGVGGWKRVPYPYRDDREQR